VALILRRAERARDGRQPPVLIAGSAAEHVRADSAQLRPQIMDLQYTAIRAAANACFAQAGLALRDVNHLQVYDAFSINIPIVLEAVGFCKHGGRSGQSVHASFLRAYAANRSQEDRKRSAG